MVYPGSGRIASYNLSTNTFNVDWKGQSKGNVFQRTGEAGCVTVDARTNHLYIIGGEKGVVYGSSNATQIFDITQLIWSFGPELNGGRTLHTCNVHERSSRVYTIGGSIKYRDITPSIVYLDITNIANVSQLTRWELNPYNYTPAYLARSVVYGDYILIIGAYGGHSSAKGLQILNTIDGTITEGPEMVGVAVYTTAAIIVDGILYAFGGRAFSEPTLDTWQYYVIGDTLTDGPTTAPTYQPTLEPTTSNPSSYPTTDPIMEPSANPTADPIIDPMNNSSNNEVYYRLVDIIYFLYINFHSANFESCG